MKKLLMTGAVALLGLTGVAASTAMAATTAAGASTGSVLKVTDALSLSPGSHVTNLYHLPVVDGKVVHEVAGKLVPVIDGTHRNSSAQNSPNWSGYADTANTFQAVSGSWTEPTATCGGGGGGGGGLLGGLLGGGGSYASFWVGLDGYSSSSVEQTGTDSDCSGSTPSYYAWYEMYPAASVDLSTTNYPVHPGDTMTGSVLSNSTGTLYTLTIKDTTQNWSYSINEKGSGEARSSAEFIAEAPASCSLLLCSEEALANFGHVNFTNGAASNTAGRLGPISAFVPIALTMTNSGGGTNATPGPLNAAGNAFTINWEG